MMNLTNLLKSKKVIIGGASVLGGAIAGLIVSRASRQSDIVEFDDIPEEEYVDVETFEVEDEVVED